MKQVTAIIDTKENLETSNQVIPDGMIVKEDKSFRYKVGNGEAKFSQLKSFEDHLVDVYSVPEVEPLQYKVGVEYYTGQINPEGKKIFRKTYNKQINANDTLQDVTFDEEFYNLKKYEGLDIHSYIKRTGTIQTVYTLPFIDTSSRVEIISTEQPRGLFIRII